MRPLQPFEVALTGNRLIEASAGTGKTYTITTLFLRLLVERGLGVDQILVVTFTKAATAELRDRIRQRLRAAVVAFDSDTPTGDKVLDGLKEATGDRRGARLHLASELRRFDEAAIFTIHGFCQRMLRDNAFESGLVFDAELVTDAAPLLQEVVQDFWAREVYDAPERFARHLADRKISPGGLVGLAASAVADPELIVIPERTAVDLEISVARYTESLGAAATLWREDSEAVTELLLSCPGLNRNQWKRPTTERRLRELADLFAADPPPNTLFKDFDRFTPERLQKATKKNQDPPVHAIFEACAQVVRTNAALGAALDTRLMNLRLDLMDYARRELGRRREASRTLSFDDLLHQLERALRGSGGPALGKIIRERFPAALIDEFQDTDPVQYRIFREIFTEGETLFLIGDPKQAIYGFRRADIYTYLGAGARVRSAHTLDVNWRADPSLIRAVNALHDRARAPFLDPRITFEPVRPADGRRDGLAGTGRHAQPLEVLFVSRESLHMDPEKPINKGWAVENLPGLVAGEIARLLASDTTLEIRPPEEGRPSETRPLVPGDIAVLIRRNAEAAPLQEALRRCSIPSVLHSDANVFGEPEAEALERVVRGLAEPSRDGLVRSALATSLFGLSGEALQSLLSDEDAWQRWTQRFEGWGQKWRSRGFMLAFGELTESQRVPERLLGLPDGERRLTNLLHLAELVHQEATTEHLGLSGVAHWLGQMRAEANESGAGGDDSRQMRMESDARAVQILTLHKSKGLEYPVVYCPYLWDAGPQPGGGEPVRFHDPTDEHRAKLDLGSEDLAAHHVLAARESLAERLRVTYVALTRARHRTVVVWGAFRDVEKTGLAYLLHQPDALALGGDVDSEPEGVNEALAAETQRRVRTASDEELREDLEQLAVDADRCIVVSDLGDGPGPDYAVVSEDLSALAPRVFHRALDRTWRTASFSALASGRPTLSHVAVEGRDLDEADVDAPRSATPTGESVASEPPVLLHDFPRGARAGNLLHAIFEQIDFTRPDTVSPLVRSLVPRFGYESHWSGVLEQAVIATLATSLDATQTLRLADVTSDRRMVEMEFVFPVAASADVVSQEKAAAVLDARGLSRVFAAHGPSALSGYADELAALRFFPVRGYLRGFIDLVFEHEQRWYVVDYKSNYLGPTPADYSAGRLARAMVSHHYPLQYHLYTLALHRYLEARLPGYDYDRSFGGVRYLFVRGMSPDDPGGGVFGDRPTRAMVEALSALVDGEEVGP
jgi:exodeoxyribonuclease V beta subunit